MFEPSEVSSLDVTGCADALDAWVMQQRQVGARRLALAAHWADLHSPPGPGGRWGAGVVAGDPEEESEPVARIRGRTGHRPGGIQVGAEGTPRVTEFAATELGVLLQTTTPAAVALLRDALELRHRLPQVWAAVQTGQVEDWKARKVATATRMLSLEHARIVDSEILEALVGLPFGRALDVVEARVIAADPAGHETRRTEQAAQRYVAVGRRPSPAGLRTLVAQTTVGDVARIIAMVDHLATLLAATGDTDSRQVRRAKALALLANPAQACLLLARAHATPCDEPAADDQPASAVELAAAFGRLLTAHGGSATKVCQRLRPRAVLYVHLAEEALTGAHPGTAVARVRDLGPVGLDQLKEWLGADTVTVKPVIDLAAQVPVDAYEIPAGLAEAVQLRHPYETFPYGTLSSHVADGDHTQRYVTPDQGGPPGQTAMDNLGPLGRLHHRAKTFGGFTCYQPLPGLYLWRVPSGRWYRVDHTGTTPLGKATPDIIDQRRRSRPSPMDTALARRIHFALAT
jgi:hypothetical protein